jgi:hypothetical protein
MSTELYGAMLYVREVLGLPPLGPRPKETPAQRADRERKHLELQERAEELRRQREGEAKAHARDQKRTAFRMWMTDRKRAEGTIAETYLRRARCITCAIPGTVAFLPPRTRNHHPAMMTAFGIPNEPEPGRLLLPPLKLAGLHLTLLRPDGRGKADVENAKLTIGPGHSMPIVVAPPNDLGGLIIAEGIEDALSAHQETGLGAWAAGTANRLPGLAQHLPPHIECVTILQDDDDAGRRFSEQLAEAVCARGIQVLIETGGPCGCQ